MKNFNNFIKEIKSTLTWYFIFNNILTSIVIFLFSYLVLAVISFHAIYAIVPSIIYFIVSTYVRLKENLIKNVEKKYRMLDEKLRTASQYSNFTNPIVDELKLDVIREAGTIRSSEFFHTNRTIIKIFLCVGLSFAIIFASLFDAYFFNMRSYIDDKMVSIPNQIKDQIRQIEEKRKPADIMSELFNDDIKAGTASYKDIYGKGSLAKLGDEIVNVELQSYGYKLSLKNEQEIESQEFNEVFPTEIYAQGAGAYKENIAKDDQEVVKKYFSKIARSEVK